MSDPRLRMHAAQPAPQTRLPTGPRPKPPTTRPRRPIGRYLVDGGVLSARQLIEVLSLQAQQDAPLGEILIAEGLASEAQVLAAVAQQHGLHVIDLDTEPPDPDLSDLMPPAFWLRHRVIPWMRLGSTLVLATARPDRIDAVHRDLPDAVEQVLCVVAPHRQILTAIARRHAPALALRAENRVAPEFSARTWKPRGVVAYLIIAAVLLALCLAALAAPQTAAGLLCALAALTLVPVAGLKLCAFALQLVSRLHDPPQPGPPVTAPPEARLPRVSVMVPLFRETEIAGDLIRRLERMTYPKALLDILLVLEERDTVTRDTLAATQLPHWMRVVEVPDNGQLTTKPRALNYALDFCYGDIVGVWDAEDAPDPDQIQKVAARFAVAPPEVACLQGILDYYNPRTNWLSRCFTIEYAGWWRVLLPGVARMGLVIPLGGTTLFFRRDVLERLGAWDAHNVTEDADLGIRLARQGYRTELIATVTHEEANCRAWPWIRQRSRWIKGFMMTWLVHMRRPRQLLRDLGLGRFVGLQILLAATMAQFLLAPVLWSFWLISVGLPHPVSANVAPATVTVAGILFLATEIGNLTIAAAGVSGRRHRFLLPWVVTMPFYFTLGAVAAVKAVAELLMRPHFWDKTRHGQAAPDLSPACRDCPRPGAGGS